MYTKSASNITYLKPVDVQPKGHEALEIATGNQDCFIKRPQASSPTYVANYNIGQWAFDSGEKLKNLEDINKDKGPKPLEPKKMIPVANDKGNGPSRGGSGGNGGGNGNGNGNGNGSGNNTHVHVEVFPKGCNLVRGKDKKK
jgi:hypothetical protein